MSDLTAATRARSIQAGLGLRLRQLEQEFAEAVARREWGKLAGYHGMREALKAATREVALEGERMDSGTAVAAMSARFAANAAECDEQRQQALDHERYGDVAAHDGVGTGWLMAKKVLDAEMLS